ncbi:nucleotide disphospho-sugar-binding domain-containing protein [Dactylosporangium sp. NPDC000555]|uniref:nucleotide disphospho-sugar-binding domain-containing protein n=1 Tax=Dactylosporangium sp. NPDC000555 TaxID=3154260 RepID=UPI0033169F69
MRVLFVPHANKAHLHIMLPLAWALRTAGHDVLVASKPDLADAVMAVGFTPAIVGEVMNPNPGFYPGHVPAPPPAMPSGQRQEMPRQEDFARDDPADRLARATWGFGLFSTPSLIAGLIGLIRDWRADLVIWDQMVYAAPVAAKVCGVAQARMMMGPDGITQLRAAVRDGEDALRDWLEPILLAQGSEFGEDVAVGDWTIEPMPPWQWRPAGPLFVPVRMIPFNPPAPLPDWLSEPQQGDRVCLTLGASHRDGRGAEASAADMLRAMGEIDAEVIATFNAKQLASVDKIPGNVRVVDFVPLAALLPSCSAVIHHGGAGTFATAVESAVPQLIIPGTHWGFQWWGPLGHANGLQDQGAGLFVADADHLSVDALVEDVRRVLEDPAFRGNARRLRLESVAVPAPNDVVPVLERLTREARDLRDTPAVRA